MALDPNWKYIDSSRENMNAGQGMLGNILSAVMQNKMKQGNDAKDLQNAITLMKMKAQIEAESPQGQLYKKLIEENGGNANNPDSQMATVLGNPVMRSQVSDPSVDPVMANTTLPKMIMKSFGKSGPTFVNPSATINNSTTTDAEIQNTAQGIMAGTLPPDISKITSFRDRTRVVSALQQKGYDLTNAGLQYKGREAQAPNAKLQDAKVNQAIHLRALADQYYDPSTSSYNVPQAQYSEMVMGLASLVANSNTATDSSRREINQKTAAGDINGLASYLTGTPKNASTQEMMRNLIDSIDRQGSIAEQERNAYTGKTNYGSSFNNFLSKSPSKQENPAFTGGSGAQYMGGSEYKTTPGGNKYKVIQ
jgi:hypothetical protein